MPMRATSALVLLVLAAVSCQKTFFTGTPRWMRTTDRYNYHSSNGDSIPERPDNPPPGPAPEPEPSVYMSALRFPEGPAWRDGERSGAHLVLWKDGEEVLDLPVEHYPEPDRHRIRGGYLWWDDSDGLSTYVYRNGKEVFRYNGDEILRGLLEVNGKIHTLGQRAGRGGFSYRINGTEVFSHPSAQVLGSFDERAWEGGALMQDGDSVYYCYSTAYEYRVMQGKKPLRIISAEKAGKVFDIRVWGGSVYRTQQRGSGGGSLVMMRDDTVIPLGLAEYDQVHLCRLVPFGNQMLVKGYSTRSGSDDYQYWFRSSSGVVQLLESDLPLADLYPDNPDGVAVYLDGGRVNRIWDGKQILNIWPGRYTLYTPACTTLYKGTLYAVLSDAGGSSHLLLQGDQATTFSFNGCFTGIRIE